ncbi:phosphoinositide phosphatase SAC4-like [Salvia hispanica]|nr:phosphoinositide phosphatase SAC4-like [Salvia hispanica]
MLLASPTALLSSENVINETISEITASTSECGSSRRGRDHTGTELGYTEAQNYEVLEDFSDSFVRWVTYGEAICH